MRNRGAAAVFVDRDGVLVEEVGHLHRRDQLRVLPGVAEALRRVRSAGFLVIVVTNQSAVARGMCSEEELAAIHADLQAMLRERGSGYDDLYYCPHHPTEAVGAYRVQCSCRKPSPGMLLAARSAHGLDLSACVLVGDKNSDVEAAHRAGCVGVLVRSGHGAREADHPWSRPEHVCDDLGQAVTWILDRERSTTLERS